MAERTRSSVSSLTGPIPLIIRETHLHHLLICKEREEEEVRKKEKKRDYDYAIRLIAQTLVDLPQSFLGYCSLPVPKTMAGVDFSDMFKGNLSPLRDHVRVQNRHEVNRI